MYCTLDQPGDMPDTYGFIRDWGGFFRGPGGSIVSAGHGVVSVQVVGMSVLGNKRGSSRIPVRE